MRSSFFAIGFTFYIISLAVGIGLLASGSWSGMISIFGSVWLAYTLFEEMHKILLKKGTLEKTEN